ncbi:hypothetical protein GCM10022224_052410 [Nonomuraea antimicrobica]|uniref:Cytokinin riboside 5'-monophosphate phosphoribohydrolase n=1 Tax=Nonomuraea antimicrobica TaxID=561173 RepID=A0ABP7C9X1_9ACTN
MTTSTAPAAAALAVCVFCGARSGNRPAMVAAAREIGSLIGARSHHLVYGAGGSGLMGEVARSAQLNGSAVTGYAPRFIYERERGIDMPSQTLHITEDLFERKRRMIEHADAFIALPGGYGTLDEIMEVLCLRYLDVRDKPLILLNIDGFWRGLVRLADELHEAGFTSRGSAAMLHLAATPAEAVDLAERLARTAACGA